MITHHFKVANFIVTLLAIHVYLRTLLHHVVAYDDNQSNKIESNQSRNDLNAGVHFGDNYVSTSWNPLYKNELFPDMETNERVSSSSSSVHEDNRNRSRRINNYDDDNFDNYNFDDAIVGKYYQTNEDCKSHLLSFLKGTTDAKDNCAGFMNAYVDANCGSIIGGNSLSSTEYRDDDNDDYLSSRLGDAFQCCQSLYTRYIEDCEQNNLISNFNLLCVASVLLLCECAKSAIKKYEIHFLPEAAGCILVGTAIGTFAHLALGINIDDIPFNEDLFLCVLLPPIIFEAALSVNKKEFRRRRLSILMFAVVGTLLSSFTAGFMVHFTSLLTDQTFPLLDSFVYGALISSIDPVAILSVLTSLNMCDTDTIFILVFGESLLNDGIAITLFKSLVGRYRDENSVTADQVLGAFADFMIVGSGSLVIGLGCGVACLLYFYALKNILHPVMEVGTFFLWALVPYYICDAIEFSGIVAIVAMGFFMDIYIAAPKADTNDNSDTHSDGAMTDGGMQYAAFNDDSINTDAAEGVCNAVDACADEHDNLNLTKYLFFEEKFRLSQEADKHVRFVAHLTASLSENAIFVYLGSFLLSNNYEWNFQLVSIGVAAAVLSRVLMVWAACNAVWYIHIYRQYLCFPQFKHSTNNYKTKVFGSTVRVSKTVVKIQDSKTRAVLVLAGLRGAVSLALVENVPIYNGMTDEGSQVKPIMKAMTSASIIFTMFFFGGSAYYILKALNIESDKVEDEMENMNTDIELTSPSNLTKNRQLSLIDAQIVNSPKDQESPSKISRYGSY